MTSELNNEIKLALITMIISAIVTSILGFRILFYTDMDIEGMILVVIGFLLMVHFAKLKEVTKALPETLKGDENDARSA